MGSRRGTNDPEGGWVRPADSPGVSSSPSTAVVELGIASDPVDYGPRPGRRAATANFGSGPVALPWCPEAPRVHSPQWDRSESSVRLPVAGRLQREQVRVAAAPAQ